MAPRKATDFILCLRVKDNRPHIHECIKSETSRRSAHFDGRETLEPAFPSLCRRFAAVRTSTRSNFRCRHIYRPRCCSEGTRVAPTWCIVVIMRATTKAVRQTISLPTTIATQVRSMAKSRRLSANRMILELIESGMAAEKRKQQRFFELAERFRAATDEDDVKRLGDELGRMVFGG